jgi:tRNA(fMet)-specific endonuclease VapC
MYFLDTNTCIYYLNGTHQAIARHFEQVPAKEIKLPSVVKAELLFGLEKSQKKDKIQTKYLMFMDAFEIISFDDAATLQYAKIRKQLEKNGTMIGANDLFIAATVLAHKGILVTNNVSEFSRVPHLSLENWIY